MIPRVGDRVKVTNSNNFEGSVSLWEGKEGTITGIEWMDPNYAVWVKIDNDPSKSISFFEHELELINLAVGDAVIAKDFPSLGIGQITKNPDKSNRLYAIIFLQDPKLVNYQKEFDNEYYIEFTDEYYFPVTELQRY